MRVAVGWRLGLGSADVCFLPGEGFPFCSLTELLLCLNSWAATNSPLATLTTSLGLCYCAHRQIKASLDLKLEVFFVLFCFSFVCSSGPFWEENGKNNKIRSDGAISGHTWLGISEMLGAPPDLPGDKATFLLETRWLSDEKLLFVHTLSPNTRLKGK